MLDSTKHWRSRHMLVSSLKKKGIKSLPVLEAMMKVPRHWFMNSGLEDFAYEDKAYPINAEQTISQPYTVAFQTELLRAEKGEKVLEIGTGSGYQTAILMELGLQVYTVERQQKLFKKADRLFNRIGIRPKKNFFSDGYLGLPEFAPFDAIIVTAGAPETPKPLLEQLAINGRLVIPVGKKEQIMMRFVRTSKQNFDKETFGVFRFVPLLENKK